MNFSGLCIQCTDEDRSRIGRGLFEKVFDDACSPGGHVRIDENDLLRSCDFSQFEDVGVREGWDWLTQANFARDLIYFDIVDQDESPFQEPSREALDCFRTSAPHGCFSGGAGEFAIGTIGLCNWKRIVALAAG